MILPTPLKSLAAYPQFILWKLTERGKVPIDYRTLRVASAHDPAIWMPADLAELLDNDTYHTGFVFTDKDPFFFVDIDNCLTPTGWSPLALEVCAALPGAAIEVSQSGRGLHIIGRGLCPPHACKNIALGIEIYTAGRFVALTGTNAVGDAGRDCTPELVTFAARYFPLTPVTATPTQWTEAPCADSKPIVDDDDLIAKACSAVGAGSIFGGKASFASLWGGDAVALSASYPDASGQRAYDASSADAALAQHLAFWTGKDCGRIQHLMQRSALKREKWDREDYLYRTIMYAVGQQTTVYGSKQVEPKKAPRKPAPILGATAAPGLVAGFQYLTAERQLEHFKGCVYVQTANKVFTPEGLLLKPDQFNATYGGYVFQLDDTGDKITRKAWEAFTESQVTRFPHATSTCFRPRLAPGTIVSEEGWSLVNVYVPVPVSRLQGDPSPFLDHLKRILPAGQDQGILLAYMAACVQHLGMKFQWAPLLQGTEGNGKTLFTRCVAAAVGQRYTHMPPATEVSEKFNEWLFYKIFIGIEDVYVADNKRELIEVLKPMITNDRLAMRAMQQAQVMGDNCANFMLNSNHRDAITKTKNDRRFCVFYTAQQTADDLKRDGMTGDYFPRLYQWLRAGGYAIVTDYLMAYSIPDELNPALGCHRAPETTTTKEALLSSLGGAEQEIMEAVEEGRPGFAGGWVSSVAVEKLLRDLHLARAIPPNKRRDLLRSLGYDWHPALPCGRVNNPIMCDDGKKPRLFVKAGHLACNLKHPVDVVTEYQKAQGVMLAGVESIFTKGGSI